MAFPDTSLDLTVEAAFGADPNGSSTEWSWTNLTSRLNDRDVTIVRGARDGTGRAVAQSATLVLDDDDGALSPLWPMGENWPNVKRGLPIRAYRGRPSRGAGSNSSTNSVSHVAPSVVASTATGLLLCGWMSGLSNYTLPGSMTAGPAETDTADTTMRTAREVISASGATGTRTATCSVSGKTAAASVLVHGSITIQEQLSAAVSSGDVTINTGSGTQAGWWLVAFQGWDNDQIDDMPTAPADKTGGWIPLADSGIEAVNDLHLRAWARRVNVAGVQEIKFYGRTFGEANSNHVAVYVLSGVDSFSARFSQFAAGFKPEYTPTTNGPLLVGQQITCGGQLRRTEKPRIPAASAITRHTLAPGSGQHALAYWTCEDGSDAETLAPVVIGTNPATLSGTVTLGGYSGFPGSQPIPLLGSDGSIRGLVPPSADGAFYWRGIYFMPVAGAANGASLIDVTCTGTGKTWQVIHLTGPAGGLQMRVLDSVGAIIDQTLDFDFSAEILGKRFLLSMEAVQNGANVDVLFFVHPLNDDNTLGTGVLVTDTLNGVTVGHPTDVVVGHGGMTDCAIGHMMIGTSQKLAFGLAQAMSGYPGLRAGRNLARLCAEENIPFHPIGFLDDTETMGPQRFGTFAELIEDCQSADKGFLGEPRQDFGLSYTTRSAIYARTPSLTVDLATYATVSGTSKQVLTPVYDDQGLVNEVEVSRLDGSSARAVDATSQVQGIYIDDGGGDLNLSADSQLVDLAAWLVSKGSIDKFRYPAIPINLAANTGLIAAWENSDLHHRFQWTNPPAPHPVREVDQLLLGYTETLGAKRWLIGATCTPFDVYDTGVYGTAAIVSRYDSENSTLDTGVDADDTSLSVATEAGHALWVTGSSAPTFPFDVGCAGIRLTVTQISGASSPQTFTVLRNVDGIDKALPAGEQVRLWKPARYGL